MRHIVSLLVENEAGALSRISGLFSARGYNIESLTVATTEDPTLSRMTIITTGSDRIIEQITKQLHKLIDVVKLQDMTEGNVIEREVGYIHNWLLYMLMVSGLVGIAYYAVVLCAPFLLSLIGSEMPLIVRVLLAGTITFMVVYGLFFAVFRLIPFNLLLAVVWGQTLAATVSKD